MATAAWTAQPDTRSKLPIYDDAPEPTRHPIPPTRLDVLCDSALTVARDTSDEVQTQVQKGVDEWIALEKRAEASICATVPPQERAASNALYIAIAGLAGTIVARNRNLLMRMTLPVSFAIGGAFYFTPQTARTLYQSAVRKSMEDPRLRTRVEYFRTELDAATRSGVNMLQRWKIAGDQTYQDLTAQVKNLVDGASGKVALVKKDVVERS